MMVSLYLKGNREGHSKHNLLALNADRKLYPE